MAILAYGLLILLVGGMFIGVALAGAVVGGILLILFMLGYFVYEGIMWIKSRK